MAKLLHHAIHLDGALVLGEIGLWYSLSYSVFPPSTCIYSHVYSLSIHSLACSTWDRGLKEEQGTEGDLRGTDTHL
jgi:hypothetical protein